MFNTKSKSLKKTKNTSRKSPSESATTKMVGTIAKGNDGGHWVVDKTNQGVHRWVPKHSAKLNGFEFLSEEYLKKNIGKTVKLYCREYRLEWLNKKDVTNGVVSIITFIPSGNTKVKGNYTEIEGHINFEGTNKKTDFVMSSLQMDKNKNVSTNLMNTEVFVQSK